MHFTKAVVMIGAMAPCGCMTTAALVTGPVTSIGSVAWHSSDAGASCFSIPMTIVAMPVGCVLAVAAGVEKDWDFVTTGSCRTPGTRRLRCAFDPFWGFPKGHAAGSNEDIDPTTERPEGSPEDGSRVP
jgi:hypothetical protein